MRAYEAGRRFSEESIHVDTSSIKIKHEPPDKNRENFVKVVTAGDVFDACVRQSKSNQIFSAWTTQPCSVYSLSNDALSKFVKDYPLAATELQNAFIAVFQKQEKRDEMNLSKKRMKRLDDEVKGLKLPPSRPRFFRAQSILEFGERLRRNSIFDHAEVPLRNNSRDRDGSSLFPVERQKSSNFGKTKGSQTRRLPTRTMSRIDRHSQHLLDRVGAPAESPQPSSSSRSEAPPHQNMMWFHRLHHRLRSTRSVGALEIRNDTGNEIANPRSTQRFSDRLASWIRRKSGHQQEKSLRARRQSLVELSGTQNELFTQAQYITFRDVLLHKQESKRRRSYSNRFFSISDKDEALTPSTRKRSKSFPKFTIRNKHHVYIKRGEHGTVKRLSL